MEKIQKRDPKYCFDCLLQGKLHELMFSTRDCFVCGSKKYIEESKMKEELGKIITTLQEIRDML